MKLEYPLQSILCRVSYNITLGWSKNLREIVCSEENNPLKFKLATIHWKNSEGQFQEKLLRKLFNE
jgi:hypothetical protein